MKLYTEGQVRKAIELSRDTHLEVRLYLSRDKYDYSMDEVLDLLTPIQLPSDEEIKKSTPYPLSKGFYNPLYSNKWEEGAKWMRDKIQECGK
jgi:hypothetical protein